MPEGSTPRHTTLDCRALRARFDIARAVADDPSGSRVPLRLRG